MEIGLPFCVQLLTPLLHAISRYEVEISVQNSVDGNLNKYFQAPTPTGLYDPAIEGVWPWSTFSVRPSVQIFLMYVIHAGSKEREIRLPAEQLSARVQGTWICSIEWRPWRIRQGWNYYDRFNRAVQTEECHWCHFVITKLFQLVKNVHVPLYCRYISDQGSCDIAFNIALSHRGKMYGSSVRNVRIRLEWPADDHCWVRAWQQISMSGNNVSGNEIVLDGSD